MRFRAALLALAIAAGLAMPLAMAPIGGAGAVMGLDTPLEDPEDEAKARAISRSLRCVVCQNQSIDDSEAHLAQDMRRLVRERIAAGDDRDEVIAYITARYGDFVLLSPPLQPNTYLLWVAPALILILAAGGVAMAAMRRRRNHPPEPDPLTAAERAAVNRLLAGDELAEADDSREKS